MGRKKYDGVYKDDKGIYWAYFDGKKRTSAEQEGFNQHDT